MKTSKKVLSVVLALVMVFSFFGAFLVSAEDVDMGKCTCKDCTQIAGKCTCCAYCPYLNKAYLTSCVKDENGNFVENFCCGQCTGIFPCKCGCDCCKDHYVQDDSGNGLPLLPPERQEIVISGFRAAMQKVADVFDAIFKAIFDFLRIGDIFPDLFK